jgi:hypothetical protein
MVKKYGKNGSIYLMKYLLPTSSSIMLMLLKLIPSDVGSS